MRAGCPKRLFPGFSLDLGRWCPALAIRYQNPTPVRPPRSQLGAIDLFATQIDAGDSSACW